MRHPVLPADICSCLDMSSNHPHPRRLRHGLHVALHTVATAPRESWQSVAVTAGAAASLILDPGERAGAGSQEDSEEDMGEASSGSGNGSGGQSGPVGRARVRWKEAQNEMPEVGISSCCIQSVIQLLHPEWAVHNGEAAAGRASGRPPPNPASRRTVEALV